MERWAGKVAIVTGVTSGIGEAVAEILVESGMNVVGLGRREERLEELQKKLSSKNGKFFPVKTDLKKEDDILNAFKWVKENLGGVHVLINNAGLLHFKKIEEQETEQWKETFDVNVIALQIFSREALKSMKENNISNGHIINISSLASHMSSPHPEMVTYFASKKAVTCISEGLRVELAAKGSLIRVTNISPGLVDTEIFKSKRQYMKDEILKIALTSADIADTVKYALQVPPHVLISEIVVQPTKNVAAAFTNMSEEK